MQVIMNNNMKKRLDSGIDIYCASSGRIEAYRGRMMPFALKSFIRMIISGSYSNTVSPRNQLNKIFSGKNVYRHELVTTGTRKFHRLEVKYFSNSNIVFSDNIDFGTTSQHNTDESSYYQMKFNTNSINGISLISEKTQSLPAVIDNNYSVHFSYPILVKTAYKNGTPYNRASVKGTTTGDVRVSLIPPLDWQPAVTGVTLDSFEIKFYDDADRLTAIVTGTIGDLNSTADVKMANPTLVDGSFVNISGMDDFLIKMPNTLELTV